MDQITRKNISNNLNDEKFEQKELKIVFVAIETFECDFMEVEREENFHNLTHMFTIKTSKGEKF